MRRVDSGRRERRVGTRLPTTIEAETAAPPDAADAADANGEAGEAGASNTRAQNDSVETIRLAEAGALKDVDEDDGRVEREHDVFSDAPEIDTTRADSPPSRFKKGVVTLCVTVCAINFVLVLFVAGALALGVATPGCHVERLAHQLAARNSSMSELVAAVDATVRACT